ncbi:MAG TPA: hypothetical protein VGL42_15470 [Opitutaceae bacterium]|jgi:hypothetical protein
MTILDRLERHFGRFAISGLPVIIVAGQILAKLAITTGRIPDSALVLYPYDAIHGHPWLFFTFLFAPPSASLIWALFVWWMFYFMGSALEGFWGAFRFNVFLLVGYVFAVAASFAYPMFGVTNLFLEASVFIAFAYLNPNFEFLIFFILPVRVKWLALLTWLYYGYVLVMGSNPDRLQVLASVAAFFLFFSRDLYQGLGLKRRAVKQSAVRRAAQGAADVARHRCRICGKTDQTNPEMDFRYCSRCAGEQCYCPEHIFNHEHVTGENEAGKEA